MDLGGVFIPAITPFDPVTGDVDIVAVRSNLRKWLILPVRGIVMAGSTGEAVLLSEKERIQLLEAARALLPPDRLLIAGTGAESTRLTEHLCQAAADAGADAALVQPPAYYKGLMTPDALRTHYTTVAESSPVPVILYQVPLRFSTLDLPSGLVAELSAHPNIVGIKDSRGSLDLVGELLDQTNDGFQVLVGNGAGLYAALELGAVGGILGLANMAPAETTDLHRVFAEGRSSEAGRIQERIAPVHKKIVGGFGVPGMKAALDLLGYHGGRPRPPLHPLPESDTRQVASILEAAGLLDREGVLAGA